MSGKADEQGMNLRERITLLTKSAQDAEARFNNILHGDQPTASDRAEKAKASDSILYVAGTIDEAHQSVASVHAMLDELAQRLG